MRSALKPSRTATLALLSIMLVAATVAFVRTKERGTPALTPAGTAMSGRQSATRLALEVLRQTRSEAAPAGDPLDRPRSGALTMLHVRVVDTHGRPITSGRLECEWSMPHVDMLPIDRVALDISGEVTDLELPPDTNRGVVTASAPGFAPASARAEGLRHAKRMDPDTEGRVDRDVQVVLGETIEGPTLTGAIFVDGVRRVPDRLRLLVITDGGSGDALVDSVSASYVVPKLSAQPKEFLVDSGETTPCTIPVPLPDMQGNRILDLQLHTGRRLILQVLDAQARTPAAGISLTYQGTIVRERVEGRTVSHDQLFRLQTDAQGQCVLACLPSDGGIAIFETKDWGKFDPLLRLRLGPDSPAEFRETILVHAPKASVFGALAGQQGEVLRMRASRAGAMSIGERVDTDAHGRWSFECDAPSDWVIWLSVNKVRVSQLEHVSVVQCQAYGPIALEPAHFRELTLRLVHVPAQGYIAIRTEEDTGEPAHFESLKATGTDSLSTLQLSGPSRLRIDCIPETPEGQTRFEQILQVDPANTHELVVDLHSESSRSVALRINAAVPKGTAILRLQNLEVGAGARLEIELSGGESPADVPIPAGRYAYVLETSPSPGAVCGVLDVPTTGALEIDWSGQPLPREALGVGLEWKTLDGVPVAQLPVDLRRFVWPRTLDAASGTCLVPDHSEYSVLK